MAVGIFPSNPNSKVNSTGTLGCAETDCGLLLLYDIKNRKHLCNINTDPYIRKPAYDGLPVYINRAGTRLTFMSKGSSDEESYFDCCFLVLWDTKAQKEIGKLYDMACSKSDAKVTFVDEPSDTTILTTQIDGIFRVWDLDTGTLLKTLKCQSCSPLINVSPNCPYFLSLEIEDCPILRSKQDLKCVASFSLDRRVDIEPHWSKNGQYFVSWNQQNRDITIWNIAHSKVAVNESSYEETFTEEDFEPVTISMKEEDLIEEEGPDTDSLKKRDIDDQHDDDKNDVDDVDDDDADDYDDYDDDDDDGDV